MRACSWPDKPCAHCGRLGVCRPRGLCWKCYYAPGVRELYQSNRLRRVVESAVGPPKIATRARPGTLEKIRVLEERAESRMGLWHPRDAELDEGGD